MAIQMNIPKICIHTDSQLDINAINGRIVVPKKIINLVEYIMSLLSFFKETKIEYFSRSINRKDIKPRGLTCNLRCIFMFVLIKLSFFCVKKKFHREILYWDV